MREDLNTEAPSVVETKPLPKTPNSRNSPSSEAVSKNNLTKVSSVVLATWKTSG